MRKNAATTSFVAVLLFVFTYSASALASTPAAPTNPAIASYLQEQTSLSWSVSSGATSYNIYRGTSTGQEVEIMTGVPSNFFEDTGSNNTNGSKATLGDGTTYYYKITAVTNGAESAKSTEVSVATQAASQTSIAATPGDSQVALNWAASASATSYRIYRDTLGGVGGATNFLVTGTSYTDTGLINGTTYYYVVVPVNGSGESHSAGLTVTATPKPGNSSEAPAAPPTSVTATAGDGLNILNWMPASNATSYQVFRGTSSTTVTTLIATVTSNTYTNTGLTNGTPYYYIVKAVSTGGQTSSSVVTATPYVPTTPGNFTAKASSSLVVLTWTATGSSYAVYRSTAAGAEVLLNSGLTGSTFTDAGVTNGTTYFYKVQLLNSGGTGPFSSEVSATPTGSAAQPWSGTVNFNLNQTGEPVEPVQTVSVYIPDLNRPVLAAIFQTQGANSNLQALATKYNAITINLDGFTPFNFGTPTTPNTTLTTPNDTGHPICILDYRWPQLGASRIQTLLNAIVAQIKTQQAATPHPEIANTGLILYGWSEGTDNTNLTITPSVQSGTLQPSPIASRIMAVIQVNELDEDIDNPVSTLDTAPHLLIASGQADPNSTLNMGLADYPSVTHDTLGRGIATNQGGTLTLVNDAGAGHNSGFDHPFISIWLDDILSQRLPAIVPTSAPVSLPSWQNTSSWVGTYNMTTNSNSPWNGVQLVSNLVSAKTAYTDTRPFTWLPSQNTAKTWLNYSNTGTTSAFSPAIISATTASVPQSSAFTYQITATNEPTSYSVTGQPIWLSLNTTTGVLSGTTPGSSSTSTITLTAANAEGSSSATLTLTVGTQTGQTISPFAPILSVNLGALPFDISIPTASSGLPVTVTVLSGPAIVLGNLVTITGAGTVVLAANQVGNATYAPAPQVTTSFAVAQSFSQWESFYGLTGSAGDPSATPLNDGVTNLMKYLCDIDPSVPLTAASRAALPVVGSATVGNTDYVTLTFRENAAATDIAISVQDSANLITWATVSPPDLTQQVGIDPATQDPIMEVGIIATGSGHQFVRLNVAQP